MKRLLASLAVAAVALTPLALAHARVLAAPGPAFRDVCAVPDPHATRCYALIRSGVTQPSISSPAFPSGFHPADLQAAYNLPSATAGQSQTVAIVDVYDDPKAESDLAVYRQQFGLPPCTTANGCFKKVNELGQTSPLPPASLFGNWQVEESLDVDMVSAICPKCHIILIEAFNPKHSPDDNGNLAVGDNTAAKMGANAVSNSFGTSNGEFPELLQLDKLLNHPGIAYTASSGDSGYKLAWPASSQYVTSVGGTSLYKTSAVPRGWYETAWSCKSGFGCLLFGGTNSGCSKYEAKPSWQHDPSCARRTIGDVSAVANPATGLSVYDTYKQSGWLVVGGTSASSPIVAGIYALAGNGASLTYGSYPYSHNSPSTLNDVTRGSNGTCGGSYLCTAKVGYDGPTGLGTPNGTGAF